MPDLRRRSTEPEWMDGDAVTQEDFAACLADLAMVNTLTLARRPTLAFVHAAFDAVPRDRTLTVLDVGYGAGDMLQAVARAAARRSRPVRLIGVDVNPRSEPIARAATPPGMPIEYRTGDAFQWPDDAPVDLVISSLVTHHMADAEVVRFLGWMEARARLGWFINDLLRHGVSWHGFRALAGAMRWHRFVRHDGPLSIARSFRRADWEVLIDRAALGEAARIVPWFPFRLCVERRKW